MSMNNTIETIEQAEACAHGTVVEKGNHRWVRVTDNVMVDHSGDRYSAADYGWMMITSPSMGLDYHSRIVGAEVVIGELPPIPRVFKVGDRVRPEERHLLPAGTVFRDFNTNQLGWILASGASVWANGFTTEDPSSAVRVVFLPPVDTD